MKLSDDQLHTIVRFNYKGLINYGNIGDDIFFPLVIVLLKDVLINDFGIVFNDIIEIKKYNKKVDIDINITGGGSLIHSKQAKFTNFEKNDNLYLLAGTGITDVNKCKINENNIMEFINNFDNYLFIDKILEQNFKNLEHFQSNNKLFGGFRGLLEKKLAEKHGHTFEYINDLGVMVDLLLENDDILKKVSKSNKPNINVNYNRKIILFNITYIFGIDAFKNKDISYDQYNNNIINFFINLGIYLIKNGYFILLMPFHPDNHKELMYTKKVYNNILKNLDSELKKYMTIYSDYDIRSALDILQKVHIAIGTRLHCNIICNAFLIPTINLAYGVKGVNYAVTNNLSNYVIPTFNKYLTIENAKDKIFDIEHNYNDIQDILEKNKEDAKSQIRHEILNMFSTINLDSFSSFDIIIDVSGSSKTESTYFFRFIK